MSRVFISHLDIYVKIYISPNRVRAICVTFKQSKYRYVGRHFYKINLFSPHYQHTINNLYPNINK